MTNPFAAAIETLQEAINKCVLWEDGEECSACDDRRAAIRVLEAAGRVGAKEYLLNYLQVEIDFQWHRIGGAGSAQSLNELRVMVAALPDVGKE